MIRGTTPTHEFATPFDRDMIEDLRITYSQKKGQKLLVKNLSDCKFEGKSILVTLSQEDTLKFDDEKDFYFQLKILTKGGQVVISDIYRAGDVGASLNDEILK